MDNWHPPSMLGTPLHALRSWLNKTQELSGDQHSSPPHCHGQLPQSGLHATMPPHATTLRDRQDPFKL